MRCKPCRLTIDGRRYAIDRRGRVFHLTSYTPDADAIPVDDPEDAKAIRLEAARRRRNVWARARYDALRSVGLKKTPYGWE